MLSTFEKELLTTIWDKMALKADDIGAEALIRYV